MILRWSTTLACAIAMCCGQKPEEVNVARTTPSGDKIRGPAVVTLTGLNPIRRQIQVGTAITFSAGPDLTLPFVPPIPPSTLPNIAPPAGTVVPTAPVANTLNAMKGSAAQARAALASVKSPQDLGTVFAAHVDDLNGAEGRRTQIQKALQASIDEVNRAKSQVDAFVQSSDAAISADSTGAAVLAEIPKLIPPIDSAIDKSWPSSDINDLTAELARLRNLLSALPAHSDWAAWIKAALDNREAYDRAVARVSDLIVIVAALDANTNASASAMRDSQAKLRQWRSVLSGVQTAGQKAFWTTVHESCAFSFGGGKETKVELVSLDRMAAPGTAASRQEIVTVVCSSPLSISGGFGFSTVGEADVDIVSWRETTTDGTGVATTQQISKFGYSAQSSFRPLPLLLLNMRLWEWNDTWSLHFTNGAAVDLKTGSAAGSDVEYISGLSVAVARTYLVTLGFHAGRIAELSGGYKIGEQVPDGITKAPTQSKWQPGFVIAFSYKLR